jgi:hypothetical protein
VLVSRQAPTGRSADRIRAGRVVVVDADETPELRRWLGRHQAALVRPDRTVMSVGTVADVVGRAPFAAPPGR